MQDDCIAVALGLPQLRILKQKELENHIDVTVIYRRGEVTCPKCGMVTTKENDRMQQLKQDRRLRDKVVFLTLMKRRFWCLWCGKVFTEPDEVFGSRRRSSHRFREYLRGEALHQAVRRTAQKEKVEEGLVRRCVAEEIGRRLGAREVTETPEFIGAGPDGSANIYLLLAGLTVAARYGLEMANALELAKKLYVDVNILHLIRVKFRSDCLDYLPHAGNQPKAC